MTPTIVIKTAVNSPKVAKHIAKRLVRERLVARAQVIPRVTSFYWKEENVQYSREYIVLTQTTKEMYSKVEQRIREMHPLDMQEVVSWNIDRGNRQYLDWVSEEVISP